MNKKIGIAIGAALVIIIIIIIVVALFLLKGGKGQTNIDDSKNTVVDNNNNGGIIIDSERDENDPIIPPDIDDSVKIEIGDVVVPNEYPELDWEEPPVLTYYNEEADTNNDGHVDKAEWEVWVENHPEDLNQDMAITEDEQDEYDEMLGGGELTIDDIRDMANPTVIPDTENPNTIIDPILAPSEEEQAAENEKNKADNEAAGQGLAGMDAWANQHNTGENHPELRPGATVDENGNIGNAGLNVQ